ncbi:MAG: hypothetical protein HYX79_00455 [Chloroflexi bacterium]|nr:hypothetical protein [Chloroflexota bacterium]
MTPTEKQSKLKCMRCGHEYTTSDDLIKVERACPKCRSNSVRRVGEKK